MKNSNILKLLYILIILMAYAYYEYDKFLDNSYSSDKTNEVFYSASEIPDYNGQDIIILNNNIPEFNYDYEINESFELYGELDSLGRVSAAISNIGPDLMPTEKRGSIKNIRPSGFKIVKYDIIKDGLYLYNRCHLIGYQLTGENDNELNLMTCTRYMNATLMEPYESKIASYIRKTKNHVLYRVTPVFEEDNLISKGVKMEAMSLEDKGEGIKFNIFIYNIQPGIIIDYKTGNSKLSE